MATQLKRAIALCCFFSAAAIIYAGIIHSLAPLAFSALPFIAVSAYLTFILKNNAALPSDNPVISSQSEGFSSELSKPLKDDDAKDLKPDKLTANLINVKKISGFILSMDIRGYTELVIKNPDEKIAEFTSRYLAMVNKIISEFNGFVHKTSGDGHLISFGIMDLGSHHNFDFQTHFDHMVTAFDMITKAVTQIAESTLKEPSIVLGAAIDFGEIDLRTVNHTTSKIELDIFGQPIIRCTRLEAHTKVIRENFQAFSSLLLVSPSAAEFCRNRTGFIKYPTLFKPVRDFPTLSWFLVKPYHR